METVSRAITYEEWLTMPLIQDGVDEVVGGEYRLMPPGSYAHAEILRRLNRLFDRQVDEAKVAIYDSNFGLLISQDPLICRSPDLAVLSPSETRSRKDENMHDYAALGVPERWIISHEAETIEVRQLRDGMLQRVAIVADGNLQPMRFPGVSIPISAALWPQAPAQ